MFLLRLPILWQSCDYQNLVMYLHCFFTKPPTHACGLFDFVAVNMTDPQNMFDSDVVRTNDLKEPLSPYLCSVKYHVLLTYGGLCNLEHF